MSYEINYELGCPSKIFASEARHFLIQFNTQRFCRIVASPTVTTRWYFSNSPGALQLYVVLQSSTQMRGNSLIQLVKGSSQFHLSFSEGNFLYIFNREGDWWIASTDGSTNTMGRELAVFAPVYD